MNDEQFDDLDAPWRDHRDALYSRVVQRGRLLQWRRRALVAGVLAALFAVPAVAVIAASQSSHQVEVLGFTLGHASPPATTSTTTTTVPRPVVSQPRRRVIPPKKQVVTPVPGCHESVEPKCGAFSWITPPPKDPLVVFDSFTPAAPVNGETVTLSLRAIAETSGYFVDWGDGSYDRHATEFNASCQTPTGPWAPPAVQPIAVTPAPTHTYNAPGAYTVHVEATACGIGLHLPGTTVVDVLVNVGDASASTSSTTTTTVPTPPSS